MAQHTKPLKPDGSCPASHPIKRGGLCFRKDSSVIKQERRPGESKQECVSRKIPILINEGMKQDQAIAVANSICDLRKDMSIDDMEKIIETIEKCYDKD